MAPDALILIGRQRRLLLPTLQAARACGIARRIVLGNADTRRLRWSAACTRHVQADLDDEGAVLASLRALAREFPAAVLAPCDCEATRLLDRLEARLPLRALPTATTAAIDILDDKSRFQSFCEDHGLAVPPARVLPSRGALDFEALAGALGLPFIVKPTCCSGSRGVVVVRAPADLQDGVLGAADYPAGAVIVQRYIEGRDIDVDLYAVRGRVQALAIHGVDGHTMAFSRHGALEAMGLELCRAAGYSGPMNIDARLEAGTGRVYLIESNPRFWASLTAPAARGMNFLRAGLDAMATVRDEPRVLADCSTDTRHPVLRPAAWWTLLTGRGDEGRLLRAQGLDPYAWAVLATEAPAMAARVSRRVVRRAARLLRVPVAPASAR